MTTHSDTSVENRFRRGLIVNKRQIGCWLSLGSEVTTEVVGVAGFDWLLLDCEHAPNDVLSLIPQLMALKDSASTPVVRPPSNDAVTIKRLLDIGCHSFLIPMIESAEQARQAVAATRYPPRGIRGVSVSQRSNRYGAVPDYFKTIDDQIAVVVQIESKAGVDAVDEIAAVEGVDALFVGPSDLAATHGHLGNPNHRDVQLVIERILAAATKHNKAAGILAPLEIDAKRYLNLGFSMVAVGSDLGLLRMHSQALADKYRSDEQVVHTNGGLVKDSPTIAKLGSLY
jgi:2-dehydro-3-deoxyglucarate aldolase